MRISDWSSDVCSSDLADAPLRLAAPSGWRLREAQGSAGILEEAAVPPAGPRARRLRPRPDGIMTTAAAPHIEIFTDGACSGNPGQGGWGSVLRHKDTETELSGGEPATTNNRMEMRAAIMAMEALKRQSKGATYTDSQHL